MRKWKQPMANPVDPVPGDYRDYVGFQKTINSNKGEVDPDKLEEHIQMLMSDTKFDWEVIDPIDFRTLKPGDRIRYTIINDKDQHVFRTGGWITAIDQDNYEWLAYMAHTQTSWTVQKDSLVYLFVTRKKPKKEKVRVHKFKLPGDEERYNSYLPDSNGVLQRVHSTNVRFLHERFENTYKFRAAKSGEPWEFLN